MGGRLWVRCSFERWDVEVEGCGEWWAVGVAAVVVVRCKGAGPWWVVGCRGDEMWRWVEGVV